MVYPYSIHLCPAMVNNCLLSLQIPQLMAVTTWGSAVCVCVCVCVCLCLCLFLVCVSSPKRIHGVKARETCLCSYICNLLHLVPMLVNRNRSEPIRRGCIIDASRRVADKTCVVLCCVALCYIVLCLFMLYCVVLIRQISFHLQSRANAREQEVSIRVQGIDPWVGKCRKNKIFSSQIILFLLPRVENVTKKDHLPRYLYLLS